jgi:hypothetical protein
MEVDLSKKLVFPSIVQTNLRPDIVLLSDKGKKLIMIELTQDVKGPTAERKQSIQSYSTNVDREAGIHGCFLLK